MIIFADLKKYQLFSDTLISQVEQAANADLLTKKIVQLCYLKWVEVLAEILPADQLSSAITSLLSAKTIEQLQSDLLAIDDTIWDSLVQGWRRLEFVIVDQS